MFRIKICGVTTADDARMIAESGADAIGLNFYAGSPRCVDVAAAETIMRSLPSQVAKVGVFVNSSVESIQTLRDQLGLDYVQLHGDEPWDDIRQLGAERVIRALRCRSEGLETLAAFVDWCREQGSWPASVLLDAFQPGQYGGTGARLDWQAVGRASLLREALPLTLAGGLNPGNVAEAIRTARPRAVDTASGVESAPGVKSPERVFRFVQHALAAFHQLEQEAG